MEVHRVKIGKGEWGDFLEVPVRDSASEITNQISIPDHLD